VSNYDYSIHYRRFHSSDARHYETLERLYERVLGSQVETIPETARILDFGCGFGGLLRYLRKRFPDAEGVDASPAQVQVARDAGLPVTLVAEDAFPGWAAGANRRYDAVFLFDVLEHIPVDAQIDFLRDLVSTVKRGGILFVKVPNARSPLGMQTRYIDWTHQNSFTEASLEFVCLNAGLDEIVYLPDESDLQPRFPWLPRWGLRWHYCKMAGRAMWRLYMRGELGPQAADMRVGHNLLARARVV
jgi:2-polyprenyl-3-methyl-5-hydroxy-6-metoxy-1,4-benzoquinol methylase